MKYNSVFDLASKADWEGGIEELMFGYGIDVSELPDGTPADIVYDFELCLSTEPALARIRTWLDAALQEGQ